MANCSSNDARNHLGCDSLSVTCTGRLGGVVLALLLSIGCSDSDEKPVIDPPTKTTATSASKTVTSKSDPKFDFLTDSTSDDSPTDRDTSYMPTRAIRFTDVAEVQGLSHIYDNGASGKVLMVESIGGGCAWLDFDRDGQLDAYLVQGGDPAAATAESRPADQLFRQMAGKFSAAGSATGLNDRQYSQGVAVGDFDNDGFDDIYVTNVGRNSLWQNQGDGTFLEVTDRTSVGDERWSSSAAWADLDRDGDLDLYVCNYLQYDPYHPMECLKDGEPALCHPRQLPDWPDECYRNEGDGTFTAVAQEWKLAGPGNKALGVAILDMNQDGWPDIYVANDTTANFLFLNQQGQGFQESALRLGCALNAQGAAQASMGVAVGDYDENGLPDVFLTHFTGESNTLFQNLGEYGLHDVSNPTGIRTASWSRLGFGTVMQDLNHDGRTELMTVNGHIDERNADGDGYRQRAQLLTFDGQQWHDVSAPASPYFDQLLVGRGLSLGDYNADGLPDLLAAHQNSPAALLENHSEHGHWLKLTFSGHRSNRRGIGCQVKAALGDRTIVAQLAAGTSFATSHEPALFLGLDDWSSPVDLEITWPSGTVQTLKQIAVDQSHTAIEPVEADPVADRS